MSLSGILGLAGRSLLTHSEALAVIQDNIANAATPGYARQRPVLSPVVTPRGLRSLGVEISGVQILRDRLLDFQVFQSRQSKSFFEKKLDIFHRTEPLFSLAGESGIGKAVDGFFGAVSALSVAPSDLVPRRALLASAGGLAASFRTTFTELAQRRLDLDTEGQAAVSRINSLLERVAELAARRSPPDSKTSNGSIETNLHQTLDSLAELIDFTLIRQNDGALSVVTSGGVLLVTGAVARRLSVSVSGQQLSIVDANGVDITAAVRSERGELSAILEARNELLPRFLGDVNRLAKSIADQVNEQLARGVDLAGGAGQALFEYAESSVTGAGRAAGVNGAATPSPPDTITVDFSGGVAGSITASLDSFFVGAAPPTVPSAGDTVSVTFTSADGSTGRTITTAPLLGGEDTAAIAARLNDQIALDAELAGKIAFSDPGNGRLKVVLSDTAGQGFSFVSSTNNPAFTTGLETGGSLGGQSAEEIAASLNEALATEAAGNPALAAARVRFAAIGGEVKIDGDLAFDFTVTETPGATEDAAGLPDVTGFVSGLPASGSAGGAQAASTLTVSGITPAEIAAGTSFAPGGNQNALALAALADGRLIDGSTFSDFYALLVNDIGNEGQNAAARLETQEQLLLTAENLRDSLSGVDLNEEGLRLLEFERAFQAMLRVIQVADRLTVEVLGIVR